MIVLPITNSYEKEILFPPGIIFPLDKYIDANQIVQFQPDFKLFQYYLSQPLKKPFQLGGNAQMIQDMEGKVLIIYRKIEGREIDILSYRMIPNHIEDYDKWFFENVRIPIHRIDSYTNMIPEVMDIEYELNGNTTSKRKDELINIRLSYYVDTLIYDPKTKEIHGFPHPFKKPIDITNALRKYQ